MKKNLIKLLGMYFMFSLFLGCENKLEMTLPQGPQGPKGDPGLSAFDIWKEYYGKDPNTPIEDFFNSLKGKDGKDGAVPIIGDNGNWVIDGIDTGIPARGKDGKDGVTPEIGSNGNWYIGGVDTGVPAKGKDGSNGRNGLTPYIKDGTWWIGGEDTGVPVRGADGADGADGSDGSDGVDGVTPTIEVGPGPDYFWIINGTTTTISAKGKDGQDGLTPVVGNNGNWFIGGEDTGKPSVIIPTIGDNGNWFIGGVDTGKPARGPKGEDGQDGTDGVDGKSAYELWKEAVDEGEMTNKDGSPYTGGNTWEDFLIWLQGGDVSVLHQYWLSQGNTGDLQAFIDALFSCHCDGITVSVIALNECVELNPDGSLKKTYNATLKVGAAAGTTVVVTGDGLNLQGIVAAGASEVTFSIPRGKTDQQLAINCQLAGKTEQVTKYAVVSALKYIEITSPVSVQQVSGEQQDVVTITFATAPAEIFIETTKIYDEAGVIGASGWSRSEDGKIFTKTYTRGSGIQQYSITAKGENGECSILNNLFTIPQLTPVDVTQEPTLSLIEGNNCDLLLTLQGTPGMTVKATYGSPATTVTLVESPSGTYTTTDIPRTYTAYSVSIVATKVGAGTVTKSINVSGSNLIANNNPLTISKITGVDENEHISLVQRKLTNTTSAPLTVKFTRTTGISGAFRQGEIFPFEKIIPAGGSIVVDFYRDYTATYATGSYVINMKTVNECGLIKDYPLTIDNQTSYRAKFTLPTGFGGEGQPGGPGWDYETSDPDVTFTVEVFDGLPGKFVEMQLFKGLGYTAVARGEIGADGRLTRNITMKASELVAALADGSAFFKFFNNSDYTGPVNIGATKERIDFKFD